MPYLHFPSLETLTLVLLSKSLPGDVQVAGCTAYRLPEGAVVVETAERLTSAVIDSLATFGVQLSKQFDPVQRHAAPPHSASCWAQVLPLQPKVDTSEAEPSTVLFRVESVERFTALASEMIRLGNDRISYRCLQPARASGMFAKRPKGENLAILMRVIEPPYYSLIDVMDSGPAGQAVAYHEQAPRVWVRMGYQHPLAGRLDPPAGHFLLIDPPHQFEFVAEAAFSDIYQALDVRMPRPAHAWQARETPVHIEVPLVLTTAGQSQPAQLWVLKHSAMDQLEQLITRSDDALVDQLAFAVIPAQPEPIVLLRARPSRGAPPILVLDAVAYHPYLRLPNLFVPVGTRLQPPLRRDAISKLLAADTSQLTWLESIEPADPAQRSGPFRAQSVADAAFRPLTDWVEYVLEHHAQALDTWIQSHRFQFDSFVCAEDLRKTTKAAPSASRAPSSKSPVEDQPTKELKQPPTDNDTQPIQPVVAFEPAEMLTASVSPNKLVEELKSAEAGFLQSSEPLDAPERMPMWHRLALLNSALNNPLDATLCWAQWLWFPGNVRAENLQEWFRAELKCSDRQSLDPRGVRGILASPRTQGNDVSLVAAYVVNKVASQEDLTELQAMAAELTQFFERRETSLPVRIVWLAALAMHELVGGDALGLARVRDRLLDRLYQHGLMGEFDVASFLRGSGQVQSDQHRLLRANWPRMLSLIGEWLTEPIINSNQTRIYVKFVFAYCLVRIGEIVRGRELLHQAMEELNSNDLIHLWAGMAFNFRVEQAVHGGNNREPIPEDLVRQLGHMDRLERYKIDRLRQHSRVLEPHDRIDPYRRWHRRYTDDLYQTLAELKDLLDLKQVEKKLRALLIEYGQGPRGLRVLASALEYAPRLGDEFASQMLNRVTPLLVDCEDVIEKALLIQKSLYVAAHFGHTALVNQLVVSLRNELPAIVESYLQLEAQFKPADKERIETVENLLQFSFRGLRKLGMRDELSGLYAHIADLVDSHHGQGRSAASPSAADGDAQMSRRLSLLLCVASGYYFFGNADAAERTVDKVRQVLFQGQLSSIEQRRLAAGYIFSVSQGRPETALKRILELFQRTATGERLLPKIEDTMTTSSHFSVSELELIESALMSLLSDESALDPQSQLWLDQDEFAIRKKIHQDMKNAVR